jgi:SAM-dependent methyltransferase
MAPHERLPCWCGETDGPAIGLDYRRCARCGTAVVSALPAGLDTGDDHGLYGKTYWLEHQQKRGFPDVRARARTDLGERCVFWLERLLESVRPPGRALEIGCGHGAFVSLLGEVGFDALGMDLSPWVVEFARQTFGVAVRCGTLATLDVEPGFACIAAFDVLEHLADPLETLRRCARLLAPDGVLLLQTPWYRGEGPDWTMFQPDEHIYLFTEDSLRELLGRAGFRDVAVRESFFAYDMWVAATPGTLAHHPPREVVGATGRRLPASVHAMLDLAAQAEALRRSLADANADRTARLRQVDALTEIARRAEADRVEQGQALTAQIHTLTDRAHALTGRIQALSAEIEALTALARKAEAERAADVETLTGLLRESEADRAARLGVIHEAEAQIQELRSRLEQIERTTVWRIYSKLADRK